eukprot:Tamp_23022.p1 GENE.Tamp_23022~~Tamp_23022.p1  ORF type:complete len:310 (+),score=39.86 Tamp_23022:3-932(+)
MMPAAARAEARAEARAADWKRRGTRSERRNTGRRQWVRALLPVSAVLAAVLPACGARTPSVLLQREAKPVSARDEVAAARALKRRVAKPSAWQQQRIKQMQGLQRIVGGAFDEFGTFAWKAEAHASCWSSGVRKPPPPRSQPGDLVPFDPDAGRSERLDRLLSRLSRSESVSAAFHSPASPSSLGQDMHDSAQEPPLPHVWRHGAGGADPGRKIAKERHGRMHLPQLRHRLQTKRTPGRLAEPTNLSGRHVACTRQAHSDSLLAHSDGPLAHSDVPSGPCGTQEPGDDVQGGLRKRLLFDDFTPRLPVA